MVSPLEQSVRDLDCLEGTIAEIAIAATHRLDVNKNTAESYIWAKRQGFASWTEYQDHLAKRQGYASQYDYLKNLANKKGKTLSKMSEISAMRNGKDNCQEYCGISLQKQFEETIKTLPLKKIIKKLDKKPRQINPSEENILTLDYLPELKSAIESLSERDRYVIEQRYFQDKTLEEIGKELSYTRQRIEQIEKKALKKLAKRIPLS